MSEQMKNRMNDECFDALLKTALSEELSAEYGDGGAFKKDGCEAQGKQLRSAAKEAMEPEFSEAFSASIRALIERADEIAEEDVKRQEAKENEKIIEMPKARKLHSLERSLLRHRNVVNAASLLLLLGLGVFFMQNSGMRAARSTAPDTAMEAAPAAAPAEAGAEDSAGVPAAASMLPEAPEIVETAASPKLRSAFAGETAAAPEQEAGAAVTADSANEFSAETAALEQDQEAAVFAAAPEAAEAGLPNPIREAEDADAFSEELGLCLDVDPQQKTDIRYSIIGEAAEIRYYSEVLLSEVCCRATAEANGDPSGIYYPFDEARTQYLETPLFSTDGEPVEMCLRFTDSGSSSGALVSWTYRKTNYTMWIENAENAELIEEEALGLIRVLEQK